MSEWNDTEMVETLAQAVMARVAENRRPMYVPATVVGADTTTDDNGQPLSAVPYFSVHIDSDPPGVTIQAAAFARWPFSPGDRVMVAWDWPHAAYIVYPLQGASGLPLAWCVSNETVSVPDPTDWSGTLLTVPANTMVTAGALAVDVIVQMTFDVSATYAMDFVWTNTSNSDTMGDWSYRDTIVVDSYTRLRQPWHCIVDAAHLDADWEFTVVSYGVNAVTFATTFRAIEVEPGTETCCVWATGE